VIVDRSTGKVLGLHFTGPNAGEVMQGYAVALRYFTVEMMPFTLHLSQFKNLALTHTPSCVKKQNYNSSVPTIDSSSTSVLLHNFSLCCKTKRLELSISKSVDIMLHGKLSACTDHEVQGPAHRIIAGIGLQVDMTARFFRLFQ